MSINYQSPRDNQPRVLLSPLFLEMGEGVVMAVVAQRGMLTSNLTLCKCIDEMANTVNSSDCFYR